MVALETFATEKMLRPWSQQAGQLTLQRGNGRASRESGLLCSHSHGKSIVCDICSFGMIREACVR